MHLLAICRYYLDDDYDMAAEHYDRAALYCSEALGEEVNACVMCDHCYGVFLTKMFRVWSAACSTFLSQDRYVCILHLRLRGGNRGV